MPCVGFTGAVGGTPGLPTISSHTTTPDDQAVPSYTPAQESPHADSSGRSTSSCQDSADSSHQAHHRKYPSKDLPSPSSRFPRQHSQSSSSSDRGESPRQARFKPQKQLSQTLPAVTLPWQSSVSNTDDADLYDRRRSSNLSEAISRRSSSDSSRRSSGKRSSSEFSSEFEEYYESFQRQERKLMPIAIEEEAVGPSLQEFADDLVTGALQEGTGEAKQKESMTLGFRGVPHKPVAIKPEISPLLESSRESSGSREACSHTLKFQFGDELLAESSDVVDKVAVHGCQGAEALPLSSNVALEAKPALPDPIDLADILPQGAVAAAAFPECVSTVKKSPTSHSHSSKRSRGLSRQAGIVHFVDNLVNQASEESRHQLQGQGQADINLNLDLAGLLSEAAPMSLLTGEIHYTAGSDNGTKIKTHRIELKEESLPPPVHQLPYSAEGEFFNTNLPELCSVTIEEEEVNDTPTEGAASQSNLLTVESTWKVSSSRGRCAEERDSENSATDGDASGEETTLRELRMTIQEGQDTGKVPMDVYIAISDLSDDLVATALGEAYSIMGIDPEGGAHFSGKVDEESGERMQQGVASVKRARKVEYYVVGLLRSVFRGALKSAARELYKMKQTPSTMCSSEENLFLSYEMYAYVEDFVVDVMEDAMAVYNRQYVPPEHNRKRKSVEEIWVKPQAGREVHINARYFQAEFNSKLQTTRSLDLVESRPVLVQQPTLRRGSFDELVHRRGSQRRSSASGFKNSVLSDFEAELVKNNVSSPSLKMLRFSMDESRHSKRRASEPAAGLGFLDPGMQFDNLGKQGQSCSSLDIMSSREMILGWLDDCSQSASLCEGRYRRKRTTSSHLDWFAQDLLVDVFNDAFNEIFGENYTAYRDCLSQSQQKSVSVHSADADSLESSHLSKTASIAPNEHIPDALDSYADSLAVTVLSLAIRELLNGDRRSQSTEAPSSEYFDSSDLPYSQLEMIADSFAWKVIEDARGIVRKEVEKEAKVSILHCHSYVYSAAC